MSNINDWRNPYYLMTETVSQFSDNEWELEFASSITSRLDKNQVLTVKQIEKLEELSEKYD